ncbi:MAG TPA: hypothetical protein VMS86_11115, partial [Thermoanaerobaculia bacterium]|nr:hypothetical protein [Thermoanaerobaculia bacterium]
AVEDVRLPYWLYLDYALLIENGIAQMLGIRWWILPADVMDGGVLLTDERDPGPLRLHEARGVFSKGWALESWETAESFDHAVTRVMALGRAGELRRRGVVQTPEEGPLELPAAAGAAGGADPTVELLGVEPGRLRFRVESESPTVLATNEFFHPDWTARAEGRSLPIVRVNAAFVGAVVPGGVNEVELAR